MGTSEAQIAQEARELLSDHAPEYAIFTCKFCPSLPDCGVKTERFRGTAVNAGVWVKRELYVPAPLDPTCLTIFLHEVAHVILRHPWDDGPNLFLRNKEREASEWAKRFMEQRGVRVPPALWVKMQSFWEAYASNVEAGVQP